MLTAPLSAGVSSVSAKLKSAPPTLNVTSAPGLCWVGTNAPVKLPAKPETSITLIVVGRAAPSTSESSVSPPVMISASRSSSANRSKVHAYVADGPLDTISRFSVSKSVTTRSIALPTKVPPMRARFSVLVPLPVPTASRVMSAESAVLMFGALITTFAPLPEPFRFLSSNAGPSAGMASFVRSMTYTTPASIPAASK